MKGARYFVKQVNKRKLKTMKPNRVGERFWSPHSGHCVTISALPEPPISHVKRVNKKLGVGKKSSDWLLYTLADKGPCQRRQIEKPVSLQQIVICFSIWKTFSSSNRKNLSFCHVGLFPDFWGEKVAGSGFPCVVGGGTLGWYQHNGVLLEQQKRWRWYQDNIGIGWNRIE